LLPFLLAWIEDLHSPSGLRIDEKDTVALVAVAKRAGQPEVVLRRGSAQGSRKQMIKFHRPADDHFLSQAVATTVTPLLGQSAAQVDRNMSRGH
jgi:hypothetical protein